MLAFALFFGTFGVLISLERGCVMLMLMVVMGDDDVDTIRTKNEREIFSSDKDPIKLTQT